MIVTTGPIQAVSLPSAVAAVAALARSPRPAATACGTVKETVTLMLTPR